MFCIKCGTKLEENAHFCQNCGEKIKLNNFPIQSKKNNEGKIRKAIKKEARLLNKKSLILLVLIYFAIIVCINIGTSNCISLTSSNIVSFLKIINIIILLLCSVVITFGLTGSSLKIARNENISLLETIALPFKKIKPVLFFYLMFLLFIIIYTILLLIPGINYLVSYVGIIGIPIAFIYFYPVLDMYMYLTMDEKKEPLTFIDSLKKAATIVNGHRIEYYGMTLSFIGWWLLGILTLGILYIWLIPYVKTATANLYLKWTKERQFKGQDEGISNAAVIGFTVGGYFGFCFLALIIITFLALTGIVNDNNNKPYYNHDYYYGHRNYYNHDNYYNHHNYYSEEQNATATINYGGNNEVSFKVPDGFIADPDNKRSYQVYTNTSSNNEETIVYSTAYSYGNYYENTINNLKKQFSSDFYNIKDQEYTIRLGHLDTKCYEINVTNRYGTTNKYTMVFYPICDTRYIVIEIDSENVNQDNINEYVQLK